MDNSSDGSTSGQQTQNNSLDNHQIEQSRRDLTPSQPVPPIAQSNALPLQQTPSSSQPSPPQLAPPSSQPFLQPLEPASHPLGPAMTTSQPSPHPLESTLHTTRSDTPSSPNLVLPSAQPAPPPAPPPPLLLHLPTVMTAPPHFILSNRQHHQHLQPQPQQQRPMALDLSKRLLFLTGLLIFCTTIILANKNRHDSDGLFSIFPSFCLIAIAMFACTFIVCRRACHCDNKPERRRAERNPRLAPQHQRSDGFIHQNSDQQQQACMHNNQHIQQQQHRYALATAAAALSTTTTTSALCHQQLARQHNNNNCRRCGRTTAVALPMESSQGTTGGQWPYLGRASSSSSAVGGRRNTVSSSHTPAGNGFGADSDGRRSRSTAAPATTTLMMVPLPSTGGSNYGSSQQQHRRGQGGQSPPSGETPAASDQLFVCPFHMALLFGGGVPSAAFVSPTGGGCDGGGGRPHWLALGQSSNSRSTATTTARPAVPATERSSAGGRSSRPNRRPISLSLSSVPESSSEASSPVPTISSMLDAVTAASRSPVSPPPVPDSPTLSSDVAPGCCSCCFYYNNGTQMGVGDFDSDDLALLYWWTMATQQHQIPDGPPPSYQTVLAGKVPTWTLTAAGGAVPAAVSAPPPLLRVGCGNSRGAQHLAAASVPSYCFGSGGGAGAPPPSLDNSANRFTGEGIIEPPPEYTPRPLVDTGVLTAGHQAVAGGPPQTDNNTDDDDDDCHRGPDADDSCLAIVDSADAPSTTAPSTNRGNGGAAGDDQV